MDLKLKREQLQATQQELVGQINHIRGQLAIIEELIEEEDARPPLWKQFRDMSDDELFSGKMPETQSGGL